MDAQDDRPDRDARPSRRYDEALGYLVKHVHLALQEASDAALARLGVTSRDLGVIRVVATGAATSQQEIGSLLGIDRTSMVAMLDDLERKGLVRRQPSAQDRRRNVVALTPQGQESYEEAERETSAVDAVFLEALGENEARRFRRSLKLLLDAAGVRSGP